MLLHEFILLQAIFIYFCCIVQVESIEQTRPQGRRQRYGLLGRWSEGEFC